jgi:prepilin-type N-terminal cleavage/methylation domain-containing protein
MNEKSQPAGRQGFTLIELLVTISIIGIILGIVSVGFSTAQKNTRDSRRKGDLTAIQKSVEQCYVLESEYPDTVESGSSISCGSQTTMNSVPSDPKDTGSFVYTYSVSADNSSYCVCGVLDKSGTGNASNVGATGVCSLISDGDYYCLSNQQ